MKNLWKLAGCLLVLLGTYLPVAAQETNYATLAYSCYEKQDYVNAVKYWRLAADQGLEEAKDALKKNF